MKHRKAIFATLLLVMASFPVWASAQETSAQPSVISGETAVHTETAAAEVNENINEENVASDVTEEKKSLQDTAKSQISTKETEKSGAAMSVVVESENALLSWIKQGGLSMYMIILCSILGTYFIFERLLSLRKKNIIPEEFVETVLSKLSKGSVSKNLHEELLKICEASNTPVSRTLRAGLLVVDEGPVGIRTTIDGVAALEASRMEHNLHLLGLMANLAPLLGFLGTVTGMIGAFDAIVHAKNIGAAVVAAGISQALITTAAGLFVGIPLLAMYYFIQGKVEELVIEISSIADEASEHFAHLGGK